MKIFFLAFLAFVIIIGSCYYDSEESLYPVITPCDTTNVTYSKSIVPLIRNNCDCHSNLLANSQGGKVRLEDYPDVYSNRTLVLTSIKHTSAYPMPKFSPKLDTCLIRQVEIWINNKALNN